MSGGGNGYRCEAHGTQLQDHEARLRVLERALWRNAGAAAIAAAVVAPLVAKLAAVLGL